MGGRVMGKEKEGKKRTRMPYLAIVNASARLRCGPQRMAAQTFPSKRDMCICF